jgi:glycine/D-amino acid oxidase-like deaminating enzyme
MREERCDIAVVGGGSAGVAAAVAAARRGAKVVLIERYGFLGGAATHSFVMTYDGFLYRGEQPVWAVGGIGRELLGELDRFASGIEPFLSPNRNWVLPFNPESAKAALDSLVMRSGVATRLHATVVEASVSGERIVSLVAADHAGRFTVAADAFIDASGEGNLSALAGVPMAFTEEPRYAASLCVRIAGVPQEIAVDRAFLARVCAAVPDDETPAILRADGGFVLRLPENGDLWWMGVDILTDGVSSASLSEAEQKCRATAWAFVRELRRVPGCERATLAATGPQLGIRETRHPQARHMISDTDALAGRRVDTAVARAVWPVERHDTPGKPTMVPIGGDGFFDIPAAAIRAARIDNLWLAGRTVGAERGAFSSLRVMGTGFATGQAAGTAAVLALQGRADYPALRTALLDDGAIL